MRLDDQLGPGHVLGNIGRRLDRDARIIDIFDESQWRDLILDGPAIEPTVVGSDASVTSSDAPVTIRNPRAQA